MLHASNKTIHDFYLFIFIYFKIYYVKKFKSTSKEDIDLFFFFFFKFKKFRFAPKEDINQFFD